MNNLKGIDVSRWQGEIDWQKVKNSGIEFAFIKCSQGGNTKTAVYSPFADPYFEKNIVAAASAGIKCGVYHYLICDSADGVKKEAEYVVKLLEPYREKIIFPVAIDFEEELYADTEKKARNTELILDFLEIIDEAGYIPMLYSNMSFLKSYIYADRLGFDIWYARYFTPRSDSDPKAGMEIKAWQWTERGEVDGISGFVDLDVGYYDYGAERYAKGDVNGDGKINALDYLLCKKIVLGSYIPDEREKAAADIDGDGSVTPKDYMLLKKYILGSYQF